QRHDRHAIILGAAVVVARQGFQPDLLLDGAPETGQHAAERGHRLPPERIEQACVRRLQALAGRRMRIARGTVRSHLCKDKALEAAPLTTIPEWSHTCL